MKKAWLLEAADLALIEQLSTLAKDLAQRFGVNIGPAKPEPVRTRAQVAPKPGKKPEVVSNRACVVCGEPIAADAPPKKTICSKSCSNAKFRGKNPAAPKPARICPICQKGFVTWRKDQKLCSDCSKKERAPGVPRVDKEARLAAIRAAARRIQIPPEPTDRDYDAF